MEQVTILLGVEDIIFNTSETIINILNKKYNIYPPKSIKDIKDFEYTSIIRLINKQRKQQELKEITIKDIKQIFNTQEFWDSLQVNEEAIKILTNPTIQDYYDFEFYLSSCTSLYDYENDEDCDYSEVLQNYIDKLNTIVDLDNIGWWGIMPLNIDETEIHIDTKLSNLNTKAGIKCFIDYGNKPTETIDSNLGHVYTINDMKDLSDTLLFNATYDNILMTL